LNTQPSSQEGGAFVAADAAFVGFATASRSARCLHCGTELSGTGVGDFCCAGCRGVYELLRAAKLERYYDLRGEEGQPVADTRSESRDRKWLELVVKEQEETPGLCRIELDIQGLHCAGCVWLLEELFQRQTGGARILVNPALGRVELTVERSFPVRDYVEEIERFGYVFGPPSRREGGETSDLLLRMGISVAIAMNAMIFSISLYAGLENGALERLFRFLGFGLAIASVAVGGTVFFRAAWQGLRRGLFHFDLPISLGILTAFAGSTYSLVRHGGSSSYFDTITIFIALMLVGRFLQERVIEHNRRQLLDSAGIDKLLARRLVGEQVEIVAVGEIREGDLVLVAPGDVVPVDATLDEDAASISLDWITGESTPRELGRGELVPAGACVAGARSARLVARQDFEASALVGLLRSPPPRSSETARATPWWTRLVKIYVSLVLSAALIGFVAWMATTHDVSRSMNVVTAVLVVTCPCAFGIAVPLAYEMVQARLRRKGLFIRASGFLDRAISVRRVVFDKTGTLTTGVLRIENESVLDALAPDERGILYNLAARSTHPKSIAVKRTLERFGARFDGAFEVCEEPGRGLEARDGAHLYRLGAPSWAAGEAPCEGDIIFSVDGIVRAAMVTTEDLRPDARAEIEALSALGYEVWILSGDEREKVLALARAAGIAEDRAIAEETPEGKAAWLRAHDRGDTLMLGDGINDSLAVAEAHCSGTPAVDRPFVAARADFYLLTAGLAPVRAALRASHELRRVVRQTLGIALAYNALAVGLSYAGLMSPLVCAVLMPASSLGTVLATTVSLSEKR